MIKVFQKLSVKNDNTGDCFNACVASILELTLEECSEVTPQDPGVWYRNWQKWLWEKGWVLEIAPPGKPPLGYSLVSIWTDRVDGEGKPITHACVAYNGLLSHDPYPGGSLINKILYYHILIPRKDGDEFEE